eukprot:scaffold480010_cov41-Prasinocladus_malaysianus.AAC.1
MPRLFWRNAGAVVVRARFRCGASGTERSEPNTHANHRTPAARQHKLLRLAGASSNLLVHATRSHVTWLLFQLLLYPTRYEGKIAWDNPKCSSFASGKIDSACVTVRTGEAL